MGDRAGATGGPELVTIAWLLHRAGGGTPGVLELSGGRLRFREHGGFTEDPEVVFDAPIEEARVTFPWYYFGGGIKVAVGERRLRISFVRPRGALEPEAAATRSMLPEGIRGLFDVSTGRTAGKAWRDALGGGRGT